MSGDLDPTLFDALIEGSRRTACCDEAELRTHQLRNQRNAQRTRDTHAPLVSWPAFVVIFMTVMSMLSALVMLWALGAPL